MSPVYPVALVADSVTHWRLKQTGLASLWDSHTVIPNVSSSTASAMSALPSSVVIPKTVPWLYKLAVVLLSPFDETVYLDTDVLLVQPSLIDDLLQRSLKWHDMAFPVDALREPFQPPVHHRLTAFGKGLPPMCLGFWAFRGAETTVRSMLNRVAERLMLYQTESILERFRLGDQEFLWLELAYGKASTTHTEHLRFTFLPEEYYCPFIRKFGVAISGDLLSNSAPPVWKTSYGSYRCKAIHGHLPRYPTILQAANVSHLLPSLESIVGFRCATTGSTTTKTRQAKAQGQAQQVRCTEVPHAGAAVPYSAQ